MRTDLQLAQDLVKCLSGVSLRRIQNTGQAFREFLGDAVDSNALARIFRSMGPGRIYEVKGPLNICFLAIRPEEGMDFLVAGPCLWEPLTEAEARHQLRHSGLTPEGKHLAAEKARKLPIVPYETFHQLGTLLAVHLCGLSQPVPFQRIEHHWDFKARKELMLVEHYEELEQMRHVELRYEISTVLTEAVKQGNLSLAYQSLRQMNAELGSIVRNPNPLRNAQNLCIILNTQLRHAMEATGIHPYRLDRLSGQIAAQIEKLRSAPAAGKFTLEIIRRYCELARENAYPDLKPFTRLAVTYIKEHLSDNLTVTDTARALLVNANYLSYQFHQDMGMTFIDFVNQERARQAAALLKHTDLQIQQIAAAVGYNNTSYFAKQFAKYHHMTPRAYRSHGLL